MTKAHMVFLRSRQIDLIFLSQNVRESRVTVSDLQRSLFIVYFVVGQRVTFVAYLGHRLTHGEYFLTTLSNLDLFHVSYKTHIING